jgi:cytochrome c553
MMNKNKSRWRVLWVGLPIAVLGLAASAQTPPPGRALASQCAQCHGTNGNGPGFDELAGKSARELEGELREMKNRNPVESIMDRQARGYTDEQIRLLSEYLSSLPGSGDD